MKKRRLVDIEKDIVECQNDIDNFELVITDEEFSNYLNETYTSIEIEGIEFCPSVILRKCDPIAYRLLKSDMESNLDLNDFAKYTELQEKLLDLQYERDAFIDSMSAEREYQDFFNI